MPPVTPRFSELLRSLNNLKLVAAIGRSGGDLGSVADLVDNLIDSPPMADCVRRFRALPGGRPRRQWVRHVAAGGERRPGDHRRSDRFPRLRAAHHSRPASACSWSASNCSAVPRPMVRRSLARPGDQRPLRPLR